MTTSELANANRNLHAALQMQFTKHTALLERLRKLEERYRVLDQSCFRNWKVVANELAAAVKGES